MSTFRFAIAGIAILAAAIFAWFALSSGVLNDLGSIFEREAPVEYAGDGFMFAPVTSRDHVRGASEPVITWVEYSDFDCPFCQKFFDVSEDLLVMYPDTLQFVYRHAPAENIHPDARTKAIASECAGGFGGNDGFWIYHDYLFSGMTYTTSSDVRDELLVAAVSMGFDEVAFADCLDEKRYDHVITEHQITGVNAGVQGTPTSFVVDAAGQVQIIRGAITYEDAVVLMDALLGYDE